MSKTVYLKRLANVQNGSQTILLEEYRKISHASKFADEISEADKEKISQIKEAVKNGTYKIAGIKIAECLLREAFMNEIVLQSFCRYTLRQVV